MTDRVKSKSSSIQTSGQREFDAHDGDTHRIHLSSMYIVCLVNPQGRQGASRNISSCVKPVHVSFEASLH